MTHHTSFNETSATAAPWLLNRPHLRLTHLSPPVALGVSLVLFCAAWLLHLNSVALSLPMDNIEQTIWSASFEWGYYKHPPLPTWLMLGPTGPRRLRLSIEHLANFRGGSCYHTDLDPRWVKRRANVPRNSSSSSTTNSDR